jgi:hypothetical protein
MGYAFYNKKKIAINEVFQGGTKKKANVYDVKISMDDDQFVKNCMDNWKQDEESYEVLDCKRVNWTDADFGGIIGSRFIEVYFELCVPEEESVFEKDKYRVVQDRELSIKGVGVKWKEKLSDVSVRGVVKQSYKLSMQKQKLRFKMSKLINHRSMNFVGFFSEQVSTFFFFPISSPAACHPNPRYSNT